MKRQNFILLVIILIGLASCIVDWKHPDEILSLSPEIKEWIIDDSTMLNFSMLGDDSVLLSISHERSDLDVTAYANSVKDFNSYVIQGEIFEQKYLVNNKENVYCVRLNTPEIGHGNEITISFDGSFWIYDFDEKRLSYVWLTETDESESCFYENANIQSSFQILDTLLVNGVKCDSVLQFSVPDHFTTYTEHTVVDLFYAKHIGLVKFVRDSGVEYTRMWD